MKTIEFEPSLCKEITNEAGEKTLPKFKGKIVLRRPTFDDRSQFAEEIDFEALDPEGGSVDKKKSISVMRKLVKMSESFYQSVDIERLSDGQKFSSFDDLSVEVGCTEILMEAATFLVSGQNDSKN
jgi:hypothetical protein